MFLDARLLVPFSQGCSQLGTLVLQNRHACLDPIIDTSPAVARVRHKRVETGYTPLIGRVALVLIGCVILWCCDVTTVLFSRGVIILKPGGVQQGVGFWEVYLPGQDAPASEGGGRGVYGIFPTDDTFKLISQQAASLNARAAAVSGCDATSSRAPLPAVQDCGPTQVNGLNGTG